MENFVLSLWLKDITRKVVTRDGRPVRIVCWDRLGNYPIIACIKESDNYEYVETYNINGSMCSVYENKNDLFFADNNELTDFKKEVAEAYEWAKTSERDDFVNEFAPKLLDLARKEIHSQEYFFSKNLNELDLMA